MSEPISVVELDETLEDIEPPKLLPENYYRAEVQDVSQSTSSKGNEIWNVLFVIPPSEFPADFDDDEYPDGAILTYSRLLAVTAESDKRAKYNAAQFQKKLGLPTNTNIIDPNAWVGCPARLKVGHNTWQGQTRMQIDAVEADDEAEAAPSSGKGRKRGKAA